jgi:hypothetical protein
LLWCRFDHEMVGQNSPGLQPWVSWSARCALKASPTPRSRGANRGGRASSRAARMCHNPKVYIRPRSQHGLVFGSNPAAAGRGRDPSRAMDGTQSKNEAPCEWRPRLVFWCSFSNSRATTQGRVPLSGHLFLAANPGLKPWAMICSRFAAKPDSLLAYSRKPFHGLTFSTRKIRNNPYCLLLTDH